jgi:HEAT repeat protein
MLSAMIEKYLQLFAEAGSRKDTEKCSSLLEQMNQEFRANPPSLDEIAEGLNSIGDNRKPPGASFLLMAAWSNLSSDYTPALCRILDNSDCNAFHEQAVELLQEVGDKRAVPALAKAVSYRWDYDDWLLVPRKALKALAAIGSPEAVAVVKAAMNSSEEPIREEATSLLEDE